MKERFIAALFLLPGCGKAESSCDELNHYAPKGVIIAQTEQRCSELLDFARDASARYQMDFSTWLETVPKQSFELTGAVVFKTTSGEWTPVSFGPEPENVPCGPGQGVTDEDWNRWHLSALIPRPERLYVSLAVSIDESNSTATIRALQDFNCDRTLGVQELIGQFRSGVSPLNGGWKLKSSSFPELDE